MAGRAKWMFLGIFIVLVLGGSFAAGYWFTNREISGNVTTVQLNENTSLKVAVVSEIPGVKLQIDDETVNAEWFKKSFEIFNYPTPVSLGVLGRTETVPVENVKFVFRDIKALSEEQKKDLRFIFGGPELIAGYTMVPVTEEKVEYWIYLDYDYINSSRAQSWVPSQGYYYLFFLLHKLRPGYTGQVEQIDSQVQQMMTWPAPFRLEKGRLGWLGKYLTIAGRAQALDGCSGYIECGMVQTNRYCGNTCNLCTGDADCTKYGLTCGSAVARCCGGFDVPNGCANSQIGGSCASPNCAAFGTCTYKDSCLDGDGGDEEVGGCGDDLYPRCKIGNCGPGKRCAQDASGGCYCKTTDSTPPCATPACTSWVSYVMWEAGGTSSCTNDEYTAWHPDCVTDNSHPVGHLNSSATYYRIKEIDDVNRWCENISDSEFGNWLPYTSTTVHTLDEYGDRKICIQFLNRQTGCIEAESVKCGAIIHYVTPTPTITPTPTPLPFCPAPGGLTANSVCDASNNRDVYLDWTDVPGAATYRVIVDDTEPLASPYLLESNAPTSSDYIWQNVTSFGTRYFQARGNTGSSPSCVFPGYGGGPKTFTISPCPSYTPTPTPTPLPCSAPTVPTPVQSCNQGVL